MALFNGLAYVLLDEGLADIEFINARTEGFEDWARSRARVPAAAGRASSPACPSRTSSRAARAFARPPFSGSCMIWGMGVSQHSNGTANAHGVINLALASGHGTASRATASRRCAARTTSRAAATRAACPTNLPGYQALTPEPIARSSSAAWGQIDRPAGGPDGDRRWWRRPARGELKAMYVVGENPFLDEANLDHARHAMAQPGVPGRPGHLPARDGRGADVVLPAASLRREGRHLHQQRAAGPARARGVARRSATRARTGQITCRARAPRVPAASGSTSGSSPTRTRARSGTRWPAHADRRRHHLRAAR